MSTSPPVSDGSGNAAPETPLLPQGNERVNAEGTSAAMTSSWSKKRSQRYRRDYTFGWDFFRSCGTLFSLFYPTWEWAFLFTGISMALNGLSEHLTNRIGHIPGDMYLALGNKDYHSFWHIFVKGTLWYLAKCGTLALITFVSWLLYISFRRNLTSVLQRKYFNKCNYYRMNCVDGEGIDNPDQRMTQDVDKVCNQLAVSIIPNITAAPFVIAYYTYKTHSTAGMLGIGIIYGYFVVGTIVNKFLIAPLAKWSARVERAEGNFRYKHVTIRDNAESSALYAAEAFEQTECNRLFNKLIYKQLFLTIWRLPSNWWQQFFDYYGGLLSYALQFIPIIMLGTYDDKTPQELSMIISNNAFVYIYLVNSFSRVTDLAINAGEMAGILQRIADFVRYSDSVEKGVGGGIANDSFGSCSTVDSYPPPVIVSGELVTVSEDPQLLFEMSNVSYSLPNDVHYPIMNNLNIRLVRGQNLLVSGPSGAGKSSLLRVLMRLWHLNSGKLTYGITNQHILHVPQKAYFPSGHLSLRQQIVFPVHLRASGFQDTERRAEAILEQLRLTHLLSRCGGLDASVAFDWHECLTPGELQRLSFARLLFHRPALAILDEATNSVTVDAEKEMYELLIAHGIHFISAGHRPSLRDFHNCELKLDGKTGYEFRVITPSEHTKV